MSMYPITDEMIIGISNIPELDTSFVENANELGIRCIKDFTGFDEEGKARYSNKEKYDQLIAAGFEEYMKYDENGTEIKRSDYNSADEYYAAVTKQVFDRIDDYQETT